MRGTLKILGILLALLLALNRNLAAIFKMTNIVCDAYNKSWVVIDHCQLDLDSAVNANFTFLYPAYNIHLRIELLKKGIGYKPWINITIDACEFMVNRQDHLGRVVHNLFKDKSTVNHTCPYVGTQLVKDFSLDSKKLLVPLPNGDYLLLLTWIFDRKPQFATNVYFQLAGSIKRRRTYGSGSLLV